MYIQMEISWGFMTYHKFSWEELLDKSSFVLGKNVRTSHIIMCVYRQVCIKAETSVDQYHLISFPQ